MRVFELMTPSPITVPPETSLAEARELMAKRRIRHLLVVEDGLLVGIVTDRDIRSNQPSPATSLSVWEMNYLLDRLTIGTVMTRLVLTIGPDRETSEAARIMIDHKIGAMPVLDGTRVVGIITETDFVRAVATGTVTSSIVTEAGR
jgi:acetoin utilization protein AcuB